jgi:hypothetical protein
VNQYVNEEIMWQRLKDAQREAETRRLLGDPTLVSLGAAAAWFGGWVGRLVGLAPQPAG